MAKANKLFRAHLEAESSVIEKTAIQEHFSRLVQENAAKIFLAKSPSHQKDFGLIMDHISKSAWSLIKQYFICYPFLPVSLIFNILPTFLLVGQGKGVFFSSIPPHCQRRERIFFWKLHRLFFR